MTQMDETVLPPRVSWLPRGETAGTTGAPSLPRARAPSCQQASPAESRGTPGPPIRPASGPVPPVPRAGWRGAAKGPHPTHRPPGGRSQCGQGGCPRGHVPTVSCCLRSSPPDKNTRGPHPRPSQYFWIMCVSHQTLQNPRDTGVASACMQRTDWQFRCANPLGQQCIQSPQRTQSGLSTTVRAKLIMILGRMSLNEQEEMLAPLYIKLKGLTHTADLPLLASPQNRHGIHKGEGHGPERLKMQTAKAPGNDSGPTRRCRWAST